MKVVYKGPRESFSHYDLAGETLHEFKLGEAAEVEGKFAAALIARGDFEVPEEKTKAGAEGKK